jgi:hypothetical protein
MGYASVDDMGLRGLHSYVVICDEWSGNMTWHVVYEHGHPEGWTDRNQWVREHLPGWYARHYYRENGPWASCYHQTDLRKWCQENLTDYWEIPTDGYLYMSSEEDVMLFKMSWM